MDNPVGWNEEAARDMREEFTVGGSCGCDGAVTNGCPNCDPAERAKWFKDWLIKQHLKQASEIWCRFQQGGLAAITAREHMDQKVREVQISNSLATRDELAERIDNIGRYVAELKAQCIHLSFDGESTVNKNNVCRICGSVVG